jgi:protein TonB
MVADKRMSGTRRQASISPTKVPAPLVLPQFSPSTVAIPASTKPADQNRSPGNALEMQSISGEGEREYRLNLAREARKFKAYPPVARERAWEGIVLISVSPPLHSAWPDVSLQRSSGFEEIDRQALEMMAQAVKMAAIPPGLQGRRFQIVVPVEYRLAD